MINYGNHETDSADFWKTTTNFTSLIDYREM